MRTMSIDPGISGTGWCIWEKEDPKQFGIITAPSKLEWQQKGKLIANTILHEVSKYDVKFVYCEMPAYHQSMGGLVTARSGALVKLSYLVGLISGAILPMDMGLIAVRDWKGQLPKDVMNKRIEEILGKTKCKQFKSHIWDAVGVGLYVQGRLK